MGRDITMRVAAATACTDPNVGQGLHAHCAGAKAVASGAAGNSRTM